MVKNLNLSTNRIEKLIERSNQIDQLEIDGQMAKLAGKLDELKSNEPKLGDELNKSKSLEPAKDMNNNELKKADLKKESKNSNLSSNKDANHIKDHKPKPSNKEKSGFINAVEMKKKGLSREKLDDKPKESVIQPDEPRKLKPVQRLPAVNQSKPESKVVKNVARPINRTATGDVKVLKNKPADKKADSDRAGESKANSKPIKETDDSKERHDKNGIKIDIKVDSNPGNNLGSNLGNSPGNKADQKLDKDFKKK